MLLSSGQSNPFLGLAVNFSQDRLAGRGALRYAGLESGIRDSAAPTLRAELEFGGQLANVIVAINFCGR